MPEDATPPRLDLVDAIRARLEEAGIRDVFPYPPDSRAHPESTVVRLGVPGPQEQYFDLCFDTAVRVTVMVRRIRDLDAAVDAQAVERVLRTGDLGSLNGSYRMISIDTTRPRPVAWDESGRDVWVVEATAHIEIKEL